MILLIVEIVKIICWSLLLVTAVYWYKKISVDIFWLTVIGAALMIVGSVHDIYKDVLEYKSGWWSVASLFVLINYFTLLKRSKKFYNVTQRKLTDFVNHIEKDTKELIKDKPKL